MRTHSQTSIIVFVLFLLLDLFYQPFFYSQESIRTENPKNNSLNPSMDCRPRTCWWWQGNAVTKKEIFWEMEQMHEKGLGGVFITSASLKVYEKGNISYLSEKYFEMVKYAVEIAKHSEDKP